MYYRNRGFVNAPKRHHFTLWAGIAIVLGGIILAHATAGSPTVSSATAQEVNIVSAIWSGGLRIN